MTHTIFYRTFLFLFLFLFLISSAKSQKVLLPPSPEEVYSNSESGFALIFPKEWVLRQGAEAKGALVIAVNLKEGGVDQISENLNVMGEVLATPVTVQQYFEASVKHFYQPGGLPGFKELERGSFTVDSSPVFWIVATHQANGLDLKMIQYYFLKENKVFILTGTGSKKLFEKYRPLFDATARSFRIR